MVEKDGKFELSIYISYKFMGIIFSTHLSYRIKNNYVLIYLFVYD